MNRYSLSLLSTKLHRPPVNAEIVRRKRLHEVMDRALGLPLKKHPNPPGFSMTKFKQ